MFINMKIVFGFQLWIIYQLKKNFRNTAKFSYAQILKKIKRLIVLLSSSLKFNFKVQFD